MSQVAATEVVKPKRTKPANKQVLAGHVVRRQRLSPTFARLTLAGPALAALTARGFDQWFRMFLPRPGADELPLPTAVADEQWYSHYLSTPADGRPWMRYVTISGHRQAGTASCEIDVDVVVHGEPGAAGSGPLSTWGQTAEAGSPVALLDQGTLFKPELAAERLVLVGDETAVPGIVGILRSLPASAEGHAFLEVPEADDVQELSAPVGLKVSWFVRSGMNEVPGRSALNAARPLLAQRGGEYLYAAGESKMIAEANALLRDELDWPKELMTTVGYWHHAR